MKILVGFLKRNARKCKITTIHLAPEVACEVHPSLKNVLINAELMQKIRRYFRLKFEIK